MAAAGGRMATVGAAAALLVGAGAGCAGEYDGADLVATDPIEFAATPEYVGQAIDASESEAYRFSMSMSFGMGIDGFDAEVATGAVNGEKQQMSMDFGALFDQMGATFGEDMPPELAEADLTMEQVIDSEAIYIRAPFFAAMADLAESTGQSLDAAGQPGGALFEVFDQLGDGWGRVDIAALGDVLPVEAQRATTGGQSASPDVFLDMLRSTGEVEDLGTDEIDGVSVHGLAADVDFQDMLEAQGVDPGTFESQAGGTEAAAVLEHLQFPIEVWVDDDNLIRRIAFTFGGDSFAEMAEDLAGETGEDIPTDELDAMQLFQMSMTMDFTDYGDGSIAIEAPDGAVDITDDFVALYDDLYGG